MFSRGNIASKLKQVRKTFQSNKNVSIEKYKETVTVLQDKFNTFDKNQFKNDVAIIRKGFISGCKTNAIKFAKLPIASTIVSSIMAGVIRAGINATFLDFQDKELVSKTSDTSVESVADTTFESVVDTTVESVADTAVESVADNTAEFVEDTSVEFVADATVESVADTSVEFVNDTAVESILDFVVESTNTLNQIDKELYASALLGAETIIPSALGISLSEVIEMAKIPVLTCAVLAFIKTISSTKTIELSEENIELIKCVLKVSSLIVLSFNVPGALAGYKISNYLISVTPSIKTNIESLIKQVSESLETYHDEHLTRIQELPSTQTKELLKKLQYLELELKRLEK